MDMTVDADDSFYQEECGSIDDDSEVQFMMQRQSQNLNEKEEWDQSDEQGQGENIQEQPVQRNKTSEREEACRKMEALDMCDSFRALAAVSPGCLAMVVKSHRTWILPLCFHPPAQCNAKGSPQGSHLNPPSNGVSAPARVPRMRAPPKFSIKAVHATARGSLLVSHWLSHI